MNAWVPTWHILDGVGDPFLGHFDLDPAKTGANLIFVIQDGLADSVVLGHEGINPRGPCGNLGYQWGQDGEETEPLCE